MQIARTFNVIIRNATNCVLQAKQLTGEQLTAKITEAGIQWDEAADDEYFNKLAYLQVGDRAVLKIKEFTLFVDGVA